MMFTFQNIVTNTSNQEITVMLLSWIILIINYLIINLLIILIISMVQEFILVCKILRWQR